jgi:hypothetical protein
MSVFGSAYDNGIDIRKSVHEPSEVGVLRCHGETFAHLSKRVSVHIADRRNIDASVFDQFLQICTTSPTHTNKSKIQTIVCGLRFQGGGGRNRRPANGSG